MNSINSNQKTTRNKYSAQFKDQVLERADREGIPQVARDLGLSEALLYSWRAKRKQGGSSLESQKLQGVILRKVRNFPGHPCNPLPV